LEQPHLEIQRLLPSTPAPLREYQWDGVSFLFRSESALLADEMGLGKTVQTAIALTLVTRLPAVNRVLIVAPSSLTLNWERELARWAPLLVVRRVVGNDDERGALYQLPIEVLIASYDQIRIDALDKIPAETFDLVILDEAQRIKNASSRTAFACCLLPRRRAWALTATPVENSRDDLQGIFSFVSPGLLDSRMPKRELLQRVEPHILRRRKKEVLGELPPVIMQDMSLDLSPEQRIAYDNLWSKRQDDMTQAQAERPVSTVTLFAVLSRLKQVCNFDPASDKSAKWDALSTVLESLVAADDKVIVFSQYVETLSWLSHRMPVAWSMYHGGLDAEERDAVVQRFEVGAGPHVLLMSLRAGGVGLNLQAASHVVLFDRWWNPAVETQAIYRAHRFDRARPLHVLRFVTANTVEERISEILAAKQQLFDEYVDGAPTAGVTPLTRNELVKILQLTLQDVD
jgi:SNF2 family DNA or RNA helicase